uniref:N-acetyltransferase domain-containing protein n=1 Tax=viral metagenome TaxID=1070528 RepID=A0A6C0J732_9ZZZZ
MSTLIINNKFLHIRKVTDYDVKNNYYSLMSVLPRKTIEIFTILSSIEIEEKLKDQRIFVIEDVNSNQMIGSASVSFLNNTSTLAKVANIEDIIIKHNYESVELREELINYLTNVCVNDDNCIKCIIK